MQNCDQTHDLPGLPPGGPAPEPAQPAGAPRGALPSMTHAQRMARAQDKRSALLSFLSSEVWTVIDVAALAMNVSRRRALDALAAMERDHLIASETLSVASRPTTLYGITPHGCAVADAFDCPAFEKGRTNPSWVEHRVCGQRLRLAAEAAGWRNWLPERAVRAQAALEGWKKVPDAVAANPAGDVVAIEVERHVKTPKRYSELWLQYLQDMKAGRVKFVHFVSPPGVDLLVARAMARVTHVKLNGEAVQLTDAHRARFSFFSFSNWPGDSNG